MDVFVLLQELHTDLDGAFQRERLVKLFQVVVKGLSQLLLDVEGPVVLLVEVNLPFALNFDTRV